MQLALDTAFVRSQFPAFAEASLASLRHFENAGGSYASRQTIERLTRFYTQTRIQAHAHFAPGRAGAEAMASARRRMAAYLNVGEDELHLGPSTSQNTYVLARAFRAGWSEGDEIIVTDQDHEANIGAWRRLAETGIVVREWRADPQTGCLNPDDLATLLNDRTRLVTFTHCSNVVGHPNPVEKIVGMAKAAGARVVVDGVAYTPHGLPDVPALGADVYLFSAYKVYGPHQGVMTVRREVMETLANQGHVFNDHLVHKRLVPAGPDHAQVAAIGGILDYLDALHDHHFDPTEDVGLRGRRTHDLMQAHERALLDHYSPSSEIIQGLA